MFDIRLCGKPMENPGKLKKLSSRKGAAANTALPFGGNIPSIVRRKYFWLNHRRPKFPVEFSLKGGERHDSSCQESPLQRLLSLLPWMSSYSSWFFSHKLFSQQNLMDVFSALWNRPNFSGSPPRSGERTTLRTFPEFFWGCSPDKVPNFQLWTLN